MEEEEVKIIISGDRIKKRASNILFSLHREKKNPLALRARILKLFWMGKKLNSLFQGSKLKRGHQIRSRFAHIKDVLEGEEVKIIISGEQIKNKASNILFSGHFIEKKIRSRFALAY